MSANKRGRRRFRLTPEEIIELITADNSDDEEEGLDEEDMEVLNEAEEENVENVIIERADVTHDAIENSNEGKSFNTDCMSNEYLWSRDISSICSVENIDQIEFEALAEKVSSDNFSDPSPVSVYEEVTNFNTLVELLVQESNRYAAQKGVVFETNNEEMKAFLGINILMGYHKLPSLRDYWSSDPDMRVSYVANVMPLARFEKIRSFLHFSNNEEQLPRKDPNYDRGFKVRALFDHLNASFQNAISPAECQSIDERIIKFKGHHFIKQYIKSKPIKWGFKIWIRAASQSGYVYEMNPYLGRKEETEIGLGESVILNLSKTLIRTGCSLYFDNFFTSPRLIQILGEHGLYGTGTVRSNRKNLPKDLPLEKTMEKGQIDKRQSQNTHFVRWKDTRSVCMISNKTSAEETKRVLRKQKGSAQKVSVDVPKMVVDYNQNMGGVDKSDQMKATYAIDHRSRSKFYLRIFFDLLDTSVVNSYIIYQKILELRHEKPMKHIEFRQQLVRGLLGSYSSRLIPSLQQSRKRKYVQSQAKTSTNHIPTWLESRKRCKVCSSKKIESRTNVFCHECEAPLCFGSHRNCFETFHKQL